MTDQIDKVDILFIGGIFPKDEETKIIEKSSNYIQSAANNCQWRFINGFDHILKRPVTILNQMFIGSYPNNYRDPIIKERKFSHKSGANDINLGFVNIKVIKHILKPFNEEYYIKKWISKCNNKKIVFIYSLSNKSIRLARILKKIAKDIIVITYVGDLPINFMKGRQNHFFVKQWIKYQVNKVKNNLNLIDLFILVSKEQSFQLNLKPDQYLIIETIANTSESTFNKLSSSDSKVVLYAGALLPQYNIEGLLNSFRELSDPDISLILLGDGPEKHKIIQAQNFDSRIIYKGVVSQECAINEMKNATVLVNPTLAEQDFTKTSFPIKIIDYLLAGRPVVCQKLEGIPDEYDNHLFYFDNHHTLTDTLNLILNMDAEQINSIGKSNFDFVMKEKSEIAQTSKIFERLINNEKNNKFK